MECCVDGDNVDDSDTQNALKEPMLIHYVFLNTIFPAFRHTQRILRQFYRDKGKEKLMTKGEYEERRGVASAKHHNRIGL
jgi:hypothetical protein